MREKISRAGRANRLEENRFIAEPSDSALMNPGRCTNNRKRSWTAEFLGLTTKMVDMAFNHKPSVNRALLKMITGNEDVNMPNGGKSKAAKHMHQQRQMANDRGSIDCFVDHACSRRHCLSTHNGSRIRQSRLVSLTSCQGESNRRRSAMTRASDSKPTNTCGRSNSI